jgi:hypothetical protein
MVYYKTKLYYTLAIENLIESSKQISKEQIIEGLKSIIDDKGTDSSKTN